MEQIGWSLVDNTNTEIEYWGDTPGHFILNTPNYIILPNNKTVHCPAVNYDYFGYRLIPRYFIEGSPESIVYKDDSIVVTRQIIENSLTLEQLQLQIAELNAQLAKLMTKF